MLCTIDDVKAELKSNSNISAADLAYIQDKMRYVSGRIYEIAKRDFEPRYETRKFTATPRNVNTWDKILTLNRDLLELSSGAVTDSNALTLNSNVYAEPLGDYPIHALRISPTATFSWWPCTSCDPYNTITLPGWWGYRQRYDQEGFLQVDALAAAITTTTATAFTVADVDGADYYGLTPRISAGSLLRIEDEMMEVTSTVTGTNTVNVIRGVRGTTAATHVISTAVKAWYPQPEIRRVAARQTALIYARKGAFEQTVVSDIGVVYYPKDFVIEALAAIQGLQYA